MTLDEVIRELLAAGYTETQAQGGVDATLTLAEQARYREWGRKLTPEQVACIRNLARAGVTPLAPGQLGWAQ